MKAGTAQKIALNCFSTAVMIRLNRVHAGQMVDMRLSNEKLRARAEAMVARIAGVRPELAADALVRADGRIKPAVLVAKGLDPADAVSYSIEYRATCAPRSAARRPGKRIVSCPDGGQDHRCRRSARRR
jgi:N-acetylmuramic acid 6-phosphate etherase